MNNFSNLHFFVALQITQLTSVEMELVLKNHFDTCHIFLSVAICVLSTKHFYRDTPTEPHV